MREVPFTVLRGFFMGAADIVPGVSGGTVALVFGIYERLVASVRAGSSALGSLFRLDLAKTKDWLGRVEWPFVVSLVAGIGIAILALSHLLERLLHDYPIEMAALFGGLILGSVVVAWRLLTIRDAKRMVIMVAVGAAVFVLLGLREGTSEDTVGQVADPELWAFLLAGAIAIVAMILPGISGSFLLVLLGMYGPVLSAVTDRDLLSLGVFVVGAVIGLAAFSQVLHRALQNHYNSLIAALIGLMLGSMRVLWPWPAGVDSTALGTPDDGIVAAIVLAAVAFAVVLAADAIARHIAGRSVDDEIDELQSS